MFRAITILAVLFALTAYPALAQSRAELNVTIPFEFNVLGKVMPAGTYQVDRVTAGEAYAMRCHEQNAAVVFVAIPEDYKNSKQPRLVFRRFGKEHFLSQVWTASKGVSIKTSKAEREYTAQAVQPVIVTVVGRAAL